MDEKHSSAGTEQPRMNQGRQLAHLQRLQTAPIVIWVMSDGRTSTRVLAVIGRPPPAQVHGGESGAQGA